MASFESSKSTRGTISKGETVATLETCKIEGWLVECMLEGLTDMSAEFFGGIKEFARAEFPSEIEDGVPRITLVELRKAMYAEAVTPREVSVRRLLLLVRDALSASREDNAWNRRFRRLSEYVVVVVPKDYKRLRNFPRFESLFNARRGHTPEDLLGRSWVVRQALKNLAGRLNRGLTAEHDREHLSTIRRLHNELQSLDPALFMSNQGLLPLVQAYMIHCHLGTSVANEAKEIIADLFQSADHAPHLTMDRLLFNEFLKIQASPEVAMSLARSRFRGPTGLTALPPDTLAVINTAFDDSVHTRLRALELVMQCILGGEMQSEPVQEMKYGTYGQFCGLFDKDDLVRAADCIDMCQSSVTFAIRDLPLDHLDLMLVHECLRWLKAHLQTIDRYDGIHFIRYNLDQTIRHLTSDAIDWEFLPSTDWRNLALFVKPSDLIRYNKVQYPSLLERLIKDALDTAPTSLNTVDWLLRPESRPNYVHQLEEFRAFDHPVPGKPIYLKVPDSISAKTIGITLKCLFAYHHCLARGISPTLVVVGQGQQNTTPDGHFHLSMKAMSIFFGTLGWKSKKTNEGCLRVIAKQSTPLSLVCKAMRAAEAAYMSGWRGAGSVVLRLTKCFRT